MGSSPPPPPQLVDDVIPEILIRLPPGDPGCLLRASLVCKPWRRIISDPAFLRLYRAFHRTPPVLSFLCNQQSESDVVTVLFVTAPPLRRRDFPGWYALDARHGRVLFHTLNVYPMCPTDLVVWDPVTGERWYLSQPRSSYVWSDGAVVCAAVDCDHLDCHGGPFRLAFISTDTDGLTNVSVYSSEARQWSEPTPDEQLVLGDGVDMRPSLLVGNVLYFLCDLRPRVLEYDLGKRVLSVIDLPPRRNVQRVLMAAEDGGLGFADVQGGRLRLWSRVAGPDGAVAWSPRRVIELETLPPIRGLSTSPAVIGFAEGVSVIFLGTNAGIFTIELKSDRVRKVSNMTSIDLVIPYMSFYTPDRARGIMPPP